MRKYIITLTMSFFLIIFGAILTVSEVLDFNISDTFNDESFSTKTLSYDIKLDNTATEVDTDFTKTPVIIYDNTMASGSMKLTVTYYDDFIAIDKFSLTRNHNDVIYITADGNEDFRTVKKLIQLSINGLKNQEVYNYETALRPDVQIIINEADKDLVKIRK